MTDTRNKLLDATALVLLRDGAQALTLEAIAKQAQVSKGALFYHFASKQALIAGLVDRLVAQYDAALDGAGDEPGAATRAYLAASVTPPTPTATSTAADRTTVALFAAALVDPGALSPLRTAYQAWQQRLENDGIDPAVATVVRLAVDGWWLAQLVDLAPPPPGLHERVYATLTALIEEAR